MVRVKLFSLYKTLFLIIILTSTDTLLKVSVADNLITKICMESFKARVDSENLSIDPKMGKFTCNCFVHSLNKGFSINSAQEICKEKALEEFNL